MHHLAIRSRAYSTIIERKISSTISTQFPINSVSAEEEGNGTLNIKQSVQESLNHLNIEPLI